MVSSSDKTKLLVIGTSANRKTKLTEQNRSLKVNICGVEKEETSSKKLLGVLVNNTATFNDHLHGNEEEKGLLKQLSARIAIMKKLNNFIPLPCLKILMEGIFSSKIMFGMTVWGRIWNIPGSLDEENRTSSSITKEDIRKLQVLQDK